ncbi:MAG: putative beta-lysine N-acetyltransferase, partial [Desulfuromonas sp.]
MSDQIVTFEHSLLQHGKDNDRVYLMKVDERDLPEVISFAEKLAAQHHYSKLFAKVPATIENAFFDHGFMEEARVPG